MTSITAMDYEHVVVTFTTDSKQLADTMAAEEEEASLIDLQTRRIRWVDFN